MATAASVPRNDVLEDVEKMSSSRHIDDTTAARKGHTEFDSQQSELKESLKLDKHGLPLVPQPTDDVADPLNWPLRTRILILLLVSLVAFNTPWNFAVSNPAFVLIGEAFGGRTAVQGGYPTTVCIALSGIGGFIWIPFASVYGRKWTLIVALSIATAFTGYSAAAGTYGQLILARGISGLSLAAGPSVGAAVVTDLFFLHQRGRATGVFIVFLTNGPHVAALPGGFIARLGWRWTFYLPTITTGVLVLAMIFVLPETLDAIFFIPRAAPTRTLTVAAFYRPLLMFKYYVVVAVGWYAGVSFMFGSVLPALIAAKTFSTFFGFNSGQTGLVLSLSTTIGSSLGELVAGPIIDPLLSHSRAQQGGHARAETRLWGMIPGTILMPSGLLIYGFCVRYHESVSYLGLAFGMAIAGFANQCITTPAYAYLFDCYKSQATEVAQILNFARQTMGMTVGFWAVPFGDRVGFQFSGLTYALISLVSFTPVALTIWRGDRWRERQGAPNFNAGV